KQQPETSSFPRRRESRSLGSGNVQKSSEKSEVLDSRFYGNDGISDGIRPPRHSRAGGNLVRSVSVIYDKFLLPFISRFPLPWE
ncbi:TPA: hypothetical protein ACFNU9_001242, partial [Neisseria meningitidis]